MTDFLGLHRGLKLPPGVAGIERRDLSELMMDTRRCQVGHEEVGWRGTPSSECWMCGRPWSAA